MKKTRPVKAESHYLYYHLNDLNTASPAVPDLMFCYISEQSSIYAAFSRSPKTFRILQFSIVMHTSYMNAFLRTY